MVFFSRAFSQYSWLASLREPKNANKVRLGGLIPRRREPFGKGGQAHGAWPHYLATRAQPAFAAWTSELSPFLRRIAEAQKALCDQKD